MVRSRWWKENICHKKEIKKYLDLEKWCFSELEKKEVRHILYRYKDTISLRDEICTCPDIEVEIDITDKSPFLIRPYHPRGR